MSPLLVQVDGAYAVVKFQSRDALDSGVGREDPISLLQDCRILRKDELQVSTGVYNR